MRLEFPVETLSDRATPLLTHASQESFSPTRSRRGSIRGKEAPSYALAGGSWHRCGRLRLDHIDRQGHRLAAPRSDRAARIAFLRPMKLSPRRFSNITLAPGRHPALADCAAFIPVLTLAVPRSPRQLVGKFADLIHYGHELTANCEACQHRAPVSAPALAARLGESYRAQALIERAVCSKCRARWPKLSVTVVPIRTLGYR